MTLARSRPTKVLERRFWSLHSRTWDNLLDDPTAAAHITELVDWLRAESPRPRTVIDLGCGTGNYVLSLAPHAGTVIGVDFAPGMLSKADQKRRTNEIGNAYFVASDLHHDLPLRSGVADMVLSVYSLQFLNAPAVLAEVRRVLVLGGHLLVEVPKAAVISPRAPGTTAFSHRAFHRQVEEAAVTASVALIIGGQQPIMPIWQRAQDVRHALDATGPSSAVEMLDDQMAAFSSVSGFPAKALPA